MQNEIEQMAKTMLEASQNANVEPVLEMERKEVKGDLWNITN